MATYQTLQDFKNCLSMEACPMKAEALDTIKSLIENRFMWKQDAEPVEVGTEYEVGDKKYVVEEDGLYEYAKDGKTWVKGAKTSRVEIEDDLALVSEEEGAGGVRESHYVEDENASLFRFGFTLAQAEKIVEKGKWVD